MAILCGTDFSEQAQRAVIAAAHLARRMRVDLHLMHALQLSGEQLRETAKQERIQEAEHQLKRHAEWLRTLSVRTTFHVKCGAPDESLLDLARETKAELLVIGALRQHESGASQLGSHADRLAQRSHVPVLVVRDSGPFERWLGEGKQLNIMLGADRSQSTDAAMSSIRKLRLLAPCDVTAVHLYWPPQQFERLGLDGVRSYVDPDPNVTRTLVRDLTQLLAADDDALSLHVLAEPHLGRVGDRLATIAGERKADLLVVGSHQRGMLGRFWEGSVSRWALHTASTSVLCVPSPSRAEHGEPVVPKLRNVLAATDFSVAGNAAVALAYAVVKPGGTVHIAHVVPVHAIPPLSHDIFARNDAVPSDPCDRKLRATLVALAPRDAHGVTTQPQILESNEPGLAILQASERLAADAVCLGSSGHSGLATMFLGSVARDVVNHSQRPVMLAQKPRE